MVIGYVYRIGSTALVGGGTDGEIFMQFEEIYTPVITLFRGDHSIDEQPEIDAAVDEALI